MSGKAARRWARTSARTGLGPGLGGPEGLSRRVGVVKPCVGAVPDQRPGHTAMRAGGEFEPLGECDPLVVGAVEPAFVLHRSASRVGRLYRCRRAGRHAGVRDAAENRRGGVRCPSDSSEPERSDSRIRGGTAVTRSDLSSARIASKVRPEGGKAQVRGITASTHPLLNGGGIQVQIPTVRTASRSLNSGLVQSLVHSSLSVFANPCFSSTPKWIRTTNLRFRRPMLYPVELWVHLLVLLAVRSGYRRAYFLKLSITLNGGNHRASNGTSP